MTDSMNFGPEWLRNLSSEGTTTGIGGGGSRCQLADYRYGREDMLALYEKGLPAPPSLTMFPPIYSEQVLPPLALVPATDEERQWAARGPPLGASTRGGRGGAPGIGERGGRVSRGSRGAYQPFGRLLPGGGYDGGSGGGGWGANEQTDWSPRKDFTYNRSTSSGGIDNWRRSNRPLSEEEDGWRTTAGHGGRGGGGGGSGSGEKWNRSSSWREGDDDIREKRWHEPTGAGGGRGGGHRRMWDAQDEHLPEWATENMAEGGGTFDSSGAFHGSDDEHERGGDRGKELQKSASQHNLRNQHAPLVTSKSAVSLSINKNSKADYIKDDKAHYRPENEQSNNKEGTPAVPESEPPEPSVHPNEEQSNTASTGVAPNPPANPNLDHSNNSATSDAGVRGGDEDFDKLQEDFVSKLVVDEEPPKNTVQTSTNLPNVAMSNGGMPTQPPNLMPPPPPTSQEKWYYQDPQGDLQGPFFSSEMAEWFKAGYFSTTLFVRRRCDERFYTLGELVTLCKGNPFLANLPMLPPKQDPKVDDPEMALHYQQQFLQTQMMRARGQPFTQGEPWTSLPGFQREMFAPPMMPPMAPPDMMSSANTGASPMLHHLLNQFKMPQVPVQPPVIDETLAAANPMHPMDPLRALVQQMGGLQAMPNRLQQPGMPTPHPIPTNGTVPTTKMDSGKIESTDFMQFMQQHAALSKQQPVQMDKRIDMDSLWKHNQFQQAQHPQPPQSQQPQHQMHQSGNNVQATPQWSQSDKPISMWDPPTVLPSPAAMQVMQQGPPTTQPISHPTPESPATEATDKKNKKEEKKQRELEEKLAKKEAEEKRKQEQRKQELEKKQQEEKRKKEEEHIRKELEKAKKDAEEKRLKELAEKKRLKEQRKEEEARKKAAEELKKIEDEKERQALKEREDFKKQQQIEVRQMAVAAANQKPAKIAPWSQATTNQGLSFAEIQKIERERKAEQVLMLQQQQRQMQQTMQEQVTSPEKMNAFGVPLSWANKPMQPNHVKSLAEIQAEEQDRMLKQKEKEKAAQKEKETLSPPTSTIWCGQSLTWNNSDGAGFWDDPMPQPAPPKKAQQLQPVKQTANRQQQPQQQTQPAKKLASKQQKEQANNNANSNNMEMNSSDEFTGWCIRTLANMNTQVDIPTFVSFLRTIESALDVRDYCREYLGEKPATQQFAAQFLEKRRSFKPKQNAHKDDMCSPAPAITPSTQHSNDFQEVKGKGKKCKKSKMLKVDARILGFNVTAAQDRINVGDRDYGES